MTRQESFKRTMKQKEIANGKFYENGIVDQEQFEKFLSNIPSGYTRIIRNAKKNWELFKEYEDNSEEELLEKEKNIKKKLEVLQIYEVMQTWGIMVDYSKMENKTIDELKNMLDFVKDNLDTNFNRKNLKKNPLRDIIIDTESKADYRKQNEDARWQRNSIFEESLLAEKKIIESVLQMKRVKQKNNNNIEEDNNYEKEEFAQVVTDLASKKSELEPKATEANVLAEKYEEQEKDSKNGQTMSDDE